MSLPALPLAAKTAIFIFAPFCEIFKSKFKKF